MLLISVFTMSVRCFAYTLLQPGPTSYLILLIEMTNGTYKLTLATKRVKV